MSRWNIQSPNLTIWVGEFVIDQHQRRRESYVGFFLFFGTCTWTPIPFHIRTFIQVFNSVDPIWWVLLCFSQNRTGLMNIIKSQLIPKPSFHRIIGENWIKARYQEGWFHTAYRLIIREESREESEIQRNDNNLSIMVIYYLTHFG